jgi:hypothetical protein
MAANPTKRRARKDVKAVSQPRYTHYHGLYIPSGQGALTEFDPSHYREAGVPNDSGMAEIDALRLLNRWNSLQSLYRYWL